MADNERSTLKDLIIAGPAATGLGLAGYRAINRFSELRANLPTILSSSRPSFIEAAHKFTTSRAYQRLTNRTESFIDRILDLTLRPDYPLEESHFLFARQKALEALPERIRTSAIEEQLFYKTSQLSIPTLSKELSSLDLTHRETYMKVFKANLGLVRRQSKILGEDFSLDVLALANPATDFRRAYGIRRPDTIVGAGDPYIKRLKQTFPDLTISEYFRKSWKKEGFSSYRIHPQTGLGLDFTIPKSVKGTVLTGKGLSSRAIVGEFGIFDEATRTLNKMSFTEYFLSRYEKDILSPYARIEITLEQAQSRLRDLRATMRKHYEYVPAIPSGIASKSLQGYIETRAQTMHLKDPTGKIISVKEALRTPGLAELFGEEIFVSSSGQSMAKGKVSLIEQSKFSPGGQFFPASRKPGHALIPISYGGGKIPGQLGYEWLQTEYHRKKFGKEHARFAETIFFKEGELLEKMPRIQGDILAREGEIEVSQAMLAYSRGKRDKSFRLKALNEDIIKAFQENGKLKITETGWFPKEFPLGETLEGLPLVTKSEVQLKGLSFLQDLENKKSFYQLHLEEILPYEAHQKAFYLKASEIMRPHGVFKEMARQMKLPRIPTARIGIDILKKEPQLLLTQMTGALWATLRESDITPTLRRVRKAYKKGKISRVAAEEVLSSIADPKLIKFMLDPNKYMDRAISKSITDGSLDYMGYIKRLMSIAQGTQMSPEKFGRIFGGLSVYSDWQKRLGMQLPQAYINAIETISPIGPLMATHGNIRRERFISGKTGSVEPRIFEILSSGQFGTLGPELSEEIFRRASLDNPEAFKLSQELRQSLASFAGETQLPANLKRFELKQQFNRKAFQQFLREGGTLEIGKGFSDVYVPGMKRIRQMIPYSQIGEENIAEVFSDLGRKYALLAQGATQANKDPNFALKFFSKDIDEQGYYRGLYYKTMQEIQEIHAPYSKKLGGLFRGHSQRVVGSRALELTSALSMDIPVLGKEMRGIGSLFTVGIGEKEFGEMLKSLKTVGMASEEIETLFEAAKAGRTFGGMAWFDPMIGPYSAMPMQFKLLQGKGLARDLAVMPEAIVSIASLNKSISISPLLAAARDKDADVGKFMLLTGGLEQKAKAFWRNTTPEQVQQYVNHMVRKNLLKPKAQAALDEMTTLSIKDLQKVAGEKLSMAAEEVGRVSLGLSELKRAIAVMPDEKYRATALDLMEMLEQIPIAGKHVPATQLTQDIRAFEKSFTVLHRAIREGKGEDIAYSFRELFGLTKPTSEWGETQKLLSKVIDEGITLRPEEANRIQQLLGTKATVSMKIPGMQLEETSEYLGRAMQHFTESGKAKAERLLAGRSRITIEALPEYLRQTDITGAVPKRGIRKGIGEAIAQIETTVQNMRVGAGGKAIKYAKPIGIGLAATAGLAFLLSGPPKTVGSASEYASQDNLHSIPLGQSKSVNRTGDELNMPQQLSEPSTPRSLSIPSARIGSKRGYNIDMHLSSDRENIDSGTLTDEMVNMIGNVQIAQTNIVDNRSRLNMDELLNRIG